MSSSGIISQNNGKIFNDLLPNPYPYPAQPPTLAQVLATNPNGDDAGNQNISNLLQLETTNVVQQDQIGGHLTIGGTPSNPGSGGDLRIQGATLKGSLLVGDGISTNTLPVGANGLVLKANSAQPLGVEWGTDASGGTVMAVNAGTNISVGGTIAQPIVNLLQPLTSTLGMGSVALTDKNNASGTSGQFLSAGTGGETLWATPAYPVASITAGDNINLTGTSTAPVVNVSNPFFVQVVNAPNTTNINLSASLGGEQSDLVLNAINATTGVSTQATLDADDSVGGNGGLVKVILTDPAVASTSVEGQVLPTTATHDTRWADNIQTSDFASHLVQSELGQTKIRCEVIDTANQINSVREDITIAGAMLDTHTNTQVSTNIVAQRTEVVGHTLGCNQALQYTVPSTFLQVIQVQNTSSSGATYSGTTEQLIGSGTNQLGSFAGSSTETQGEIGASYQNLTPGAIYTGTGGIICNPGSSSMAITSSNITAGTSHLLRMETPSIGNAVIEHISVGSARNLTLSTQGALGLTTTGGAIGLTATGGVNINAGTIGGNIAPVVINNSGVGGQANPTLTLNNSNATGSVALEVYKIKPTAGANGDVLFTQSVYGKDSGNAKQEYTRISHTIRDATAGAEDGSLELGCFVNGSFANFIQLNANDAPIGEVNFTRPLDFIGGSDANSTIKTSGTGSVNLNLDASTSAGAGGIVLKTKNTTGSIAITGDQITTTVAGALTARHLRIFLPDGAGVLTPYKINLFADT